MGAYIRIAAKRYCAGFVLIDDSSVVDAQSFPAPPNESEAVQLRELYARASDLVDRWIPELFALKHAELRGGSAMIAGRAEGVVLAAVGRTPTVEAKMYRRQSLCKPADLTQCATTPEILSVLCGRVAPEPSEPELRQAAAAAVAMLAAAK